MRDPVFPAFCALGIVLCLLPLPWHWKARNTGTLLYIFWTIIGCTIFFVNSLIWAGNLLNPAPVWCDISSKLIIGLSVGITAASLCINRRLYNIATISKVSKFRGSKRRDIIIDLLLGLGLPILVMILHYIVQGHRYDILEDIGCWPVTYNTLLSIPMVLMWPIVISVASFIYAALTIRAFLETRRQFAEVLSNSHTGLNMSRYFRLMALAATEIMFSTPFATYLLVSNVRSASLNPWISWNDTHFNFGKVNYVPYLFLQAAPEVKMQLDLNRWATPAGAFLFFAYFGLAGEASVVYKRMFWVVLGKIGIKKPTSRRQKTSNWSNRFISNASSNTRDVVTFPASRPTVDTVRSNAYTQAYEQSDITEKKSQPLTMDLGTPERRTHDIESQTPGI